MKLRSYSEIQRPPAATTFGTWQKSTNSTILTCSVTGYSVFLPEDNDPLEVLDWIAQVAGKTWATPEIVGDLVAALLSICPIQAEVAKKQAEIRKLEEQVALVE